MLLTNEIIIECEQDWRPKHFHSSYFGLYVHVGLI
jgi:hypothetical protein